MADPAEKELLARLEEISRPRLAKCEPPDPSTRRAECEERAAFLYRAAMRVLGPEWSVRRTAEQIERSPRMHLDYASGARSIPVDVTLMLPDEWQSAFVVEWIRGLPRHERVAIARAILTDLETLPESDEARVA